MDGGGRELKKDCRPSTGSRRRLLQTMLYRAFGAVLPLWAEEERTVSRYVKWAQKEHSDAARIVIMILAGPVFLGLLPFVVAGVGPRLDRRLGLPSLRTGRANRIVGGLLLVLGFSLGFW